MPPIVTTGATILCIHGGQVTLVPRQSTVTISGNPVLREGDLSGAPIVGRWAACRVQAPSRAPRSSRRCPARPRRGSRAAGLPVLLATLSGITDGVHRARSWSPTPARRTSSPTRSGNQLQDSSRPAKAGRGCQVDWRRRTAGGLSGGRDAAGVGATRSCGRSGRGGMAMVYLARQTDLDRFVALKELRRVPRVGPVVRPALPARVARRRLAEPSRTSSPCTTTSSTTARRTSRWSTSSAARCARTSAR